MRGVRGKMGERVPGEAANEPRVRVVEVDGPAPGVFAYHVYVVLLSSGPTDCSPHLNGCVGRFNASVYKFVVVAVSVCCVGIMVLSDDTNKPPITL